jgi:hypothetical protein
MLNALALVLIIAWLLGLMANFTMGGAIHMLLISAFLLLLIRIMRSKKTDSDKHQGPSSDT